MRSISLSIAFLCGLSVMSSFAGTPTQWRGSSTINFSGSSTLHDWAGKVSAEPFVATVTMNDQNQPAAVKATVEVKAAKMDTVEPKRDDNMHKDMKVTDFPLITGSFDTPFSASESKAPASLPFTLTLLGKTHKIDAALSKWSVKDNTTTFDLDFDLSLKTCGIVVPSVMFVIRVSDAIHVHTSVKLVRN